MTEVYIVFNMIWKNVPRLTQGIDKIFMDREDAINYVMDKLVEHRGKYRSMTEIQLREHVKSCDYIEPFVVEEEY